ncbi:MAG TPA: S41 family peptidase [Thermoanaerobaculia bacterium]|nr:S41 family peptidase [Thermoanaerobaculia bacterium]
MIPIPCAPRVLRAFVLFAAVALVAPAALAQTKLLRFPDVHGDRVVFTYAGDLWLASIDGGSARRLTAHPGVEVFARFSPDGRWIAFTGQYDGDEQVYVMSAEGGAPQQLTYYPARGPLPPRWGYDNLVYGWTPDGESVLFRSLRYGWDIGEGRLFAVPRQGGLPEPLPMPAAGAGDYSPDGSRVVYSPLFRDFRSWKRYAGGWAQDLYLFDLATYQTTRITDHPRTDRDPMWIGDEIWFASDRTGTLNLYVHDLAAGTTEAATDSTVWDVRWPAAGPGVAGQPGGRIVYESDGELHWMDTASRQSRRIPITVPSDLLAARPGRVEAAGFLEGFGLSPGGERAVVVARGDVFTVPVEHGSVRNLTRSSGAHDKWAAWSPDGRWIAYLSDADGEEEVWIVAQDGSGEPRQLTDGGTMFRYAPVWSPDGERIAFSDKEGRLWVVRVADGSLTQVADDPQGRIGDYTWSPDGAHVAFALTEANGFSSIFVWSTGDGRVRRVSSELFNEFDPAWDPNGDYLYYVGDRQFAPQIGSFEWNYVVERESYLYALPLRKDVPHPFPPRSDEVDVEGEDGEDESEDDGEDEDDAEEAEDADRTRRTKAGDPVRIDFDGLAERVVRVPLDADNYFGLSAVEGHLLYVRGPSFYYGRAPERQAELRIYSLEEREHEVLADNITGYALSADGETVLVGQGGGMARFDVELGGKDSRQPVATDALAVDVDPREEWAQIFDEVWRRFRDFFYVETMHGYDWEALRERYRPWLADVAHRSDLNYLISEMISELNVSHAYISGGDWELPERAPVALPGARFALDEVSGRYRIARILPGHNEEPKYRSPLTEVGVEVAEGDYVLAIDGQELTAGENPYRLLRHRADRPVTLTVNDRPSRQGAREVTFQPVDSEESLAYLDMVLARRERTLELSGGRVGYIHLPDMGSDGIYEFIKWFYPQIRMQGMVIDVRGNGGGNVSSMVIERLQRELLAAQFPRTSDVPISYPRTVFHGPMAAILNETSASDGDIFPAMFKAAGLGPLVGKRSWGGVTGITNHGPLIDGGTVNVPEYGFLSADGEWIIEGEGVTPDIMVDNPPQALIEGRDPQLERAVQEVLEAMERDPMRLPQRPAPPVRVD